MNNNTYLIHYGIKGQRWGDRRFQNEDGSLTPEGMKRYGYIGDKINNLPPGTKIDGYQPHDALPPGTKIDGYQPSNTTLPGMHKLSLNEIRKNNKANYSQKMWSNVAQFLAGKVASNVGTMAQLASNNRHLKTAGAIIGIAGKVTMGAAVFKSLAATGAYFLANSAANMREKEETKK